MLVNSRRRLQPAACLALLLGACAAHPVDAERVRIEPVVDEVIRQIMTEHDVPGMAVAVTIEGRRHTFCRGVASRASGQPVTEHTLFEIGSISKTFTATLACRAAVAGALSFDDHPSRHLPQLAGSAIDQASLLDLGTYTAGGLPMQFPDDIDDDAKLFAYFANWRPEYAPGTHRVYSNPSIGLLGELAARSLHTPFEDAMERTLLPQLGLRETWLRVPADCMPRYADGHTANGSPIRVAPGPLSAPTYGIKTSASDLLRFVECNLDGSDLDEPLRRAIAATHVGYYEVGAMTQGLGWEMYEDPADLDGLLAGNSTDVIFEANAVRRLPAPRPGLATLLYDKTGSTNGFGAYVAFVPAMRLGIVLLANKGYPIPARVRAAHRILMAIMGSGRNDAQ